MLIVKYNVSTVKLVINAGSPVNAGSLLNAGGYLSNVQINAGSPVFVRAWIMTLAHLGLKFKVIGQGQGLGLSID